MKEFARRLSRDPVAIAESSLPSPVVTYRVQERTWRLEADYSYQHDAHRIGVPDQFEFDLASIPRPFWWLLAPFELSIAAVAPRLSLPLHRRPPGRIHRSAA